MKTPRYTIVHASTPNGNPRACLAAWLVRGRITPSYASYEEALRGAENISIAHGGVTATVVTADRKLAPVYGPFRGDQ